MVMPQADDLLNSCVSSGLVLSMVNGSLSSRKSHFETISICNKLSLADSNSGACTSSK